MHFSGFHIDGFGIFQNSSVHGLPDGLVLFSGENESGKTTLMQFFRTTLFGPPRGNKNTYLPLKGGRHGGRLELAMQDGRHVIVERIDKKVTIGDESGTLAREPSEDLLQGVDRQTYERVFAMGLEDLQGFDVLTQEGVRGRLLAAGAGLGAASVPETLQRLDKQIAELLTPGGRVQVIPTLKKDLSKVRTEIRNLRSRSSEFAKVTAQRDELLRKMKQLREEFQNRRLRRERLIQLERSRDVWIRLGALRSQIEACQHASSFPLNGLERLNNLSRELDELEGEKRESEEEVGQAAEQLEQIHVNNSLLECRVEIEQLIEERQKLESAFDDLPVRRKDVDHCQTAFAERLAELGKDWDAQRLAGVDTSVQVRQTVQQYARGLALAEKEFLTAEHEKKAADEQSRRAQELVQETTEQLDAVEKPQITDPTELHHRWSTIRTAQSLQHQLKSTEAALDAQRRIELDYKKHLEWLNHQTAHSPEFLTKWIAIAVGSVGCLLAIPFAVRGDWLFAVVAAVLGLSGAALVAWLNHYLQQQREGFQQNQSDELSQSQQTFRETQQEIEQFEKKLAGQSAKLRSLMKSLGVPEDAERDEDKLVELENDVEHCSELLRHWITLSDQVAQQQRNAHKAAQQLKEKEQNLTTVSKKAKLLFHEWRSWLEKRGFDTKSRPDQFEVVLQAVESARQAQKSLQMADTRVAQIVDYVNEMSQRLIQVCEQAQVELSVEQPGVETIDLLARQLDRAVKDDQARRDLEQAQNAATRQIERLTQRIQDKQREQEALLQEADTQDENEFRDRAESYETWKKLAEKISQDELELHTIAGTQEALEEIVAELSAKGPPEVTAEKTDTEHRIEEIEHELSNGDQEVGELNKVLSDMALDDKLGERLLTERSLTERLSRATRRWAVLSICRSLLERARAVYERERQPSVIRAADRFLRLMVDERYRMVSALGEETIQLEADNLERKHELFWSSGLSDQVYLATRLGLAVEFGKHSEPLPLIFDDILVRCDAPRRKAAARVLFEIAAHQQVLLFSCQQEVVRGIIEEWQSLDEPRVPLACFSLENGQISELEAAIQAPVEHP